MWAKKKRGDAWSPYGHEAARRRLLSQRRAQVLVAALAVALLYGLFLQLTLDVETVTSGGSATVDKPEQKPYTVTVAPGKPPAFLNPSVEAPEGTTAPNAVLAEENPILKAIKPFLSLIAPLAGALWLLSRVGTSARGKLAEVNLGVYKGAMPYEMHTARAHARVFTYREVDANVFGKTKDDFLFGSYLHEPPVAVRRLLGETTGDDARITRLHQGGRPRVTITAPPKRPEGIRARLADAWEDVNGWVAERLSPAKRPARPLPKRR